MVLAGLTACVGGAPEPGGAAIYTAAAPDDREHYCAWFGDSDGEILYFGQSAFWSAQPARGGRPTADLDLAGPAWIGRFDLAGEHLLPPLDVGGPADRSGVWDVLLHPNGRIYFTTFFGSAGSVDPGSGTVERFDAAGTGLNELALGTDGSVLASRYGASGDAGGSGGIAVLAPDGGLLAEFALKPPPGFRAAPKSVAWDGAREQIWVTTDLLPLATDPPRDVRHDTFVLDSRGNELRRIESPEIQFAAFAADGSGYLAELEGRELWLRIVSPEDPAPPAGGRRLPLDLDFAAGLDFVQDIQLSSGGDAVVTRWSGWVHRVARNGSIRSLRLPAFGSDGLYYTAVLHGNRVCATYCRDVSVVCRSLRPDP